MLRLELVEKILDELPTKTMAVLGDLFLDRYLDIDAALTEPSIETGLDAYQVARVRSSPGAAGTVINNLAALGVGRIYPLAVIGDDGEGYELRQALHELPAVDPSHLLADPARRTPTYTKPMLCVAGQWPRELNRLDIKNRVPLAVEVETRLLEALDKLWPRIDALLVLDQVSEPDGGVVTARVRAKLQELGIRDLDNPPGSPFARGGDKPILDNPPIARGGEKLILADSRLRIGLFQSVWLKPNRTECLKATGEKDPAAAAWSLALKCGRPVFCTWGEKGIQLADPRQGIRSLVPGFSVAGPIDTVGAGDSTSAGIACAIAAGAALEEAAAFGNLIASITIQQIGTTGTASPRQVRARWREASG